MRELETKDRIVESLLNLRDELLLSGPKEYLYKINSCLYSTYPHINGVAAQPKKDPTMITPDELNKNRISATDKFLVKLEEAIISANNAGYDNTTMHINKSNCPKPDVVVDMLRSFGYKASSCLVGNAPRGESWDYIIISWKMY